MFNKEMSFVGVIVFACLIMINEVSASETTTGVSKAEFKKTVGMTKQEVKNKFGSPDTARDGFWIYFDLYDTDTEKSTYENHCDLFFDPNGTVYRVGC